MDYQQINTQSDLEFFLRNTHYCEDAIIKEVDIKNESYVDSEYGLHGDTDWTYSVKILIQTQWEDVPAIELICLCVDKIAIDSGYSLSICGNVGSDSIHLFFDENQNATNCIVMKLLKYRLLDDKYLGKRKGMEVK